MIFISYRRGEDAGFAGRLFDRLLPTFRGQRLFMDVDSIPLGQDFVSVLEARVAECDVMLVLIGRGWLATTNRLENPDDFVRVEIASGLAQVKPVIPVLLDDVAMPRRDQLPEELQPLVRRQGVRLSHENFKTDSQKLIKALKQASKDAAKARRVETVVGTAQKTAELVLASHCSSASVRPPGAASSAVTAALQQALAHAAKARRLEGLLEKALKPVESMPLELSRYPDFAVFRDIDASWCPEVVALPGGAFLMGSPETEEERDHNEGPQHEVTIGYRFAIGRYPVTFEEYDRFCARTGREKPDDSGWGRQRRPVINVSWEDARAYAEWLREETGQLYRLPSEAEWEYACRAGATTRYAFGDKITPKDANYSKSGHGGTLEVGSSRPNPWGLHDMHGNIWEWVEDVWHNSYADAPTDGSARAETKGKSSPRDRVYRGGSWSGNSRYLRSAYRVGNQPDIRLTYLGFRVARTLD